jgi:hypothetical protein
MWQENIEVPSGAYKAINRGDLDRIWDLGDPTGSVPQLSALSTRGLHGELWAHRSDGPRLPQSLTRQVACMIGAQ